MATRMERTESPLIVIVGPTASGKTSLAVELAKRCGGEIICADSRTIYKGMDIGTAKPTMAERKEVPHWGLDLVSPDQKFTVADFKRYADEKIADIRSRGRIPFLVGGTGLYIDAVIFDFQFGQAAEETKRKYLESLTLTDLYKYCIENNVDIPENTKNKRYVIRAIERSGQTLGRAIAPSADTIIVGIATDKVILKQRISERAEQLFSNSVVDEAIILGKKYGWHHESMTGNIYPLLRSYLTNERNVEEIKSQFKALDWKLAKRQMTWFRRNSYIVWCLKDEASRYIQSALVD